MAADLHAAAARLDEPMRLAVAGQIKRGKSTLVNALLGLDVLATARRELTFNVNEILYADPAYVRVHFRDGTPPRDVDQAELARWTTYNSAYLADLKRVRRVDYGLPNPLLRRFRLIDTPGLGSAHVADSAAALSSLGLAAEGDLLDRMGRDADDVHRDSATELEQADAVLYLFTRGVHEQDRDTLSAFVGNDTGALTPLRAFGVLSKCDDDWPPDPDQSDPLEYRPLDEAASIAEGYLRDPMISPLLYTVIPVAAKVAVGAYGLAGEQFGWLAELARVEPRALAGRLADAGQFVEDDMRLPRQARVALINALGPWGIHLACMALVDGMSEGDVRRHLIAQSGIIPLRDLVTRHFGNRSILIKVNQAVRSARLAVAEYRDRNGDTGLTTQIGRKIEELQRSDHSYAEFTALSAYYLGLLSDLTEAEIGNLLDVTGERGADCASRLGLTADASITDLARHAGERHRYWSERHNDPSLERKGREVARIVLRGYDGILDRVRQAREILGMEE